jgi:hypothetical protein
MQAATMLLFSQRSAHTQLRVAKDYLRVSVFLACLRLPYVPGIPLLRVSVGSGCMSWRVSPTMALHLAWCDSCARSAAITCLRVPRMTW